MALLMEDDADEAKHKHFNYDKIVEQQNLSKKKRKKLLKKGEESLDNDDFQVKPPASFNSHHRAALFPVCNWTDLKFSLCSVTV